MMRRMPNRGASMLIIHIASTALYGSLNIYEKHSYFRKPEIENIRREKKEKKRKKENES